MKKYLLALLFASSVHAVGNLGIVDPWFTGPLIATSANVIPLGHINFEPYLFATDNYAMYNNHWKSVNQPDDWTLSYQFPLWLGIAPRVDVIVQPTVNWNYTQYESQWVWGDFVGAIEFQLYNNIPGKDWFPSVKFSIYETFPTGKYKNASLSKNLTDLGGKGSYVTTMRLIIGRLERIYDNHFLRWALNINYALSSKVHVKGLNAYGGGIGTNGTEHPGSNFQVDLGMEYNLSLNWALALDLIGTWQSKSTFQGTAGVDKNGLPAANALPSFIQYTIAPAIEYNFSANLGVIGGVWLSVAGKNANNFASGVIALNYYH